MLKWLIKLINLLFYSNLWIALAALAMTLQTQLLLVGKVIYTPYLPFLFFGSLFLYALHRIVGLEKAKPFQKTGRYSVITAFKQHIQLYAAMAALASIYFFFFLPQSIQLSLVLPALLSLGYVIPVLKGKKRLRDIHFIKVFLIALVWSWLTVFMPALVLHLEQHLSTTLIYLERTCFIFAITIPFDIRDLEIDEFNQVKTIPNRYGIKKSKAIALVALAMALFFVWLNFRVDGIGLPTFLAWGVSALGAGLLICYSTPNRHDYYYTGLLDGSMIFQAIAIYFASQF